MSEGSAKPGTLRPQELEAVYAISQAVAGAENTEAALEQILRLVRSVFIFDNMVLYEQHETKLLETIYARAIGRGRFREADLVWGEFTANDAFQSGSIVTRIEELEGDNSDRMNIRHTLGLPLKYGDHVMGALVFLRFGGPVFTPDQIHLAEFIAVHVAQLLERQQLVDHIASLEAKRRLDNLQDDFIAMISHELLTPLGFIKGYATTLLRDDTNWDEGTRREFLTIIEDESDRLRELIDNIMDSSRLQSDTLAMTFQPVRLDSMLKDIALRAKSHNENTQIDLQINTPGLQISADPTRLTQVFDNILSNATKYAPESPITIILDRVDDRACISIRDYGPGIQPEHLQQIFQRFYRAPGHRASVRGTGLGLYICRKIIQSHNGEIEALSKVGEGTTFVMKLQLENPNKPSKKTIPEA
jgi:K+-sensing histidine kinase KdpD